jgi:hypothetical protein
MTMEKKEEEEEHTKKIELVFPEGNLEVEDKFVRKGLGGKVLEQFSASTDDITSWFKQYQVETINLWNDITQLCYIILDIRR